MISLNDRTRLIVYLANLLSLRHKFTNKSSLLSLQIAFTLKSSMLKEIPENSGFDYYFKYPYIPIYSQLWNL